jgi:inositol oxygenase
MEVVFLMTSTNGPLSSVNAWDDHVKQRYDPNRKKEDFRRFDESSPAVVKAFYRLNHTNQTRDFVLAKKREYTPLTHGEMSVWEAMERLSQLVDDSDPDTDLSQIEHNFQTAEAIRRDGHPRWMQLTGLIHDLGKVLCLWGEPQWAVVGDTFPVGCAWSEKIVFYEYFRDNPDSRIPEYQTPCGIYQPGCGLNNIDMSWGHDEYLYHVVKDYLPEPALYIIRYHSFYPWHREGAYQHLTDARDRANLRWVQTFNPYDLYSKSDLKPDIGELRPYYEDLVAEFLPSKLRW